jgi:hypothetical protein
MLPRLALNLPPFCFSLLSAEITDVHHHARQQYCFECAAFSRPADKARSARVPSCGC